MLHYTTGQALHPTRSNINEKVNYTANTGNGLLNTANPNLDGTGAVVTILTAGSNGSLIKTITIKATQTTTRGMVRLYLTNLGTFVRIIDEVDVPAVIQSSIQPAWGITYEVNWYLQSGYTLSASTENAEPFIVTADAMDYAYPAGLNGL
ncbi:MAG: hypothetical protein ACXVP0_07275 [Bacteroidia bacterium]